MLFSMSKPAPLPSRTGAWLKWTFEDLTSKLEDGSIVACLSGLNRSGDLQHILMPKIFSNISDKNDVIGNMFDEKGEFGLLQIQGSGDRTWFGCRGILQHPNHVASIEMGIQKVIGRIDVGRRLGRSWYCCMPGNHSFLLWSEDWPW